MRDPDVPERDDDPPDWCTSPAGNCNQGDPPDGSCYNGGYWIPQPLGGANECCYYRTTTKCCK